MSFNKDTEIEWLRAEIITKLLKQKKIIENWKDGWDVENFQILKCEVKEVGAEEAFMLTNCYRAAIEYQFNKLQNKLHFFVKKTPQLPQEVFDSINFKALFNNEILAYEKLMPALQAFGGIDFNLVKLYYADLGSNYAIVVTDDFTSKQWNVCKAKVNMSLEHILLGVKYLAKFHAVGFAWRQQRPEEFAEFTKDLKESRYHSDVHPSWGIYLRESKKRALAATKKYEPSVDETFLQNLNTLLADIHLYGKERVKPREPLITLCHGDYLRNNVAFKYDGDQQPIDVIMFDLQTLRISSPMVDLSIFLSLSAYAAVRYQHFSQIFTLYSETVKDTYQRLLPGPVPEYLSHNCLLREYIAFLPYSISICAAFLMSLVEPKSETAQEMLMAQRTEEEIFEEVMTRGGAEVDREMAHQIKELYELNAAHEGNIFKEFE